MENEIYNGKIDSSLDSDKNLLTFDLNKNESTELDTKILKEEKKYKLSSKKTFDIFFKKVSHLKTKLNKFIKKILDEKKVIHGYGASTKGNVLLQFFNIDNSMIKFIADRNPLKKNSYTPGTKIQIITESRSRKINPNYYLVLPWHFKNEILKREINLRKNGTKFIFPLPTFKIK